MANAYINDVVEQNRQLRLWIRGANLQGFELLAARDAAARQGLMEKVRSINAELAYKSGNVSGLK